MVAYVLTHGWYDSGKPEIEVPKDVTISFLADADLSGLSDIQAAQLIVGGVAAAESYLEHQPLPNYEFEALPDDWIGRMHALNIHDLDLWMIGRDVPAFALCTDPDQNRCSTDEHVCEDGLLGIAQRRGEKHLHLMSCRVDVARDWSTWEGDRNLHDGGGGVDPTFNTELIEWTKWFLTLRYEDQAAAWEALEYEEKVYRTTDDVLREWSEVHEARKMCAYAGPDEFVAYYESLQPAVRGLVLRDAPEVVTALRAIKPMAETFREARDWFVTASLDIQDAYWRDTLSAEEREQFLMDPGVNDWAQAFAARQYLHDADEATFKGYCQTLSDGAVALLLSYDDTRVILES